MITSKQRAQLKGLANRLDAIFQVGKAGTGEAFYRQVDLALEARELIKIRVLETAPADVREVAREIAQRAGAELVQVIGSIFILYRPRKEQPSITLVK